MGTLYIHTGGSNTNSGSSNTNSPELSGAAATVAASVVSLDGSPDLSGVVTSGANQAAIYLNDATNSNQKVFWISAVDNGAKTVTVTVAPTGVTSSSWAIGGRQLSPGYNALIEATTRAGDVVEFVNTPAARATTYWTCRQAGDSTSGKITIRGASGVMPVLNVTSTPQVITGSSQANWKVQDLIIDQDGASGDAIGTNAHGWVISGCRIIDAGGDGIDTGSGSIMVINCEIANCGAVGIHSNTAIDCIAVGNNIHDNVGNGITATGVGPRYAFISNIVESNGGKGIYISGASTTQGHGSTVLGNTFYGNGDSGLEIADADTVVLLMNNIFSENGNAAGKSNVEWAAGSAELHGYHSHNVFHHSGGGGATNLTNLTANSTESTSDPLLANPASGDFTIPVGSPAKATGFPGAFLNGSTGYLDMGAVQRLEPVQRGYVIGG